MKTPKPLYPIQQLYVTDLYICIGKKEAQSVYKTFGFEDKLKFNDNVDATTYQIAGDRIIIYFSKKLKTFRKTEIPALVAHEAYHASERIKNIIGEDETAEEMTAYIIQHIVRETFKRLK